MIGYSRRGRDYCAKHGHMLATSQYTNTCYSCSSCGEKTDVQFPNAEADESIRKGERYKTSVVDRTEAAEEEMYK
jgi:DNA-directed RNA polymerase subunit M/transcription elongation factor TFIIS